VVCPIDSRLGSCEAEAAQTFAAGRTGLLDTVQLQLSREGSPGDAVVSITDAGSLGGADAPGNHVLATQTIPESELPAFPLGTTPADIANVEFDPPASVVAGTKYAIVVSSPDCVPDGSPVGHDFVDRDVTLNTYANGGVCVRGGSGTAWDCNVFDSYDFVFATYVTVTPPPPSADVSTSINAPGSAKKGALLSYTVTVANSGADTAHNVVLNNSIPAGASLAGVSTTKGTCALPSKKNPAISCALGNLAAGGNALVTVSVRVTAKAGSTVAGTASANSTQDGAGAATADPNPSNNSASLATTVTK